MGENKKFAAALITLNFIYLKSWCGHHNIPYTTDGEMISHPGVVKRIRSEVNKYNSDFGDYEQVKRYKLLADAWTMDNGLLSPTLKIKRKAIGKFYAEQIEKLFE